MFGQNLPFSLAELSSFPSSSWITPPPVSLGTASPSSPIVLSFFLWSRVKFDIFASVKLQRSSNTMQWTVLHQGVNYHLLLRVVALALSLKPCCLNGTHVAVLLKPVLRSDRFLLYFLISATPISPSWCFATTGVRHKTSLEGQWKYWGFFYFSQMKDLHPPFKKTFFKREI